MEHGITIKVYGAEEKCASCIHLPSALDTKEWLEAAVQRKYPDRQFRFDYVDIHQPQTEEEKQFSQRVIEEDLFYPVVVIDGEIVAEGNPKLKDLYDKIERMN
ncbi:YuzD family protein [Anaerobacillus sp. MEB173]|uniref:YuzD family protein n=1 Tax=Anaerobacillus sp. MEB173 TaxID=3383345 RepID=UPI003F914F93